MFRFEFKVLLLRFFLTSSIIVQLGCAQNNIPKHAVYQKSASQLPIEFKSFEAYQLAAKNWISGNRVFLTHNKIQEIKFNTPFELQAKLKAENEKSKGILLVHGLGDSPYYFSDIAQALSKQGFLVRVLLLPGHGSRPADLLSISSDGWVRLVDIQINALKAQVDEVYLGGFSTGANLVTSAALTDNAIKGLILFSPAFKAKTKLARLSPLLPLYKPWPWLKSPNQMKRVIGIRSLVGDLKFFLQFFLSGRLGNGVWHFDKRGDSSSDGGLAFGSDGCLVCQTGFSKMNLIIDGSWEKVFAFGIYCFGMKRAPLDRFQFLK